MAAEVEVSEEVKNSAFMQALGAEFSMLQGARGATISESPSRSSLYMTTLSGAVVALALVAQAAKFGQTFFIFAVAIMPVVFFLGVATYYRLLQTGVEDVVYARAISKIRDLLSQIDPARASFFTPPQSIRSVCATLVSGVCAGSNFCQPRRQSRS